MILLSMGDGILTYSLICLRSPDPTLSITISTTVTFEKPQNKQVITKRHTQVDHHIYSIKTYRK
jgi:hypothetical protein